MNDDLVPAGTFDPANLGAALVRAGALEEPSESWNRIKVDGANLVADDNAWQTPIRGGGYAFRARLFSKPEQYQSKFFNVADAEKAGRPEIADKYCKSRIGYPGENREFGTGGASCRDCIYNPYESVEDFKCSWRGDIRMQVFPEGDEAELTGDEPEYVMTLSTTAMMEFQGSRKLGTKGIVSDQNFHAKLGAFAIANSQSIWGVDVHTEPEADMVIGKAFASLAEGLVAAEVRSLKAVDEARNREWYIPSFTPIHILPIPSVEAAPELT